MGTATPYCGQVKHLKTLWREGRATLGPIATIPSVQMVQIMARAGLDWIVIDMEHGAIDGGKNVPNPLTATDENVSEGREHFGHHCGICHGLDGQSSGVPFADKMAPPVPDLASKDVQDYADGRQD